MQYFLDVFWNFENLLKIWTRIPLNYHQNTSKNTRNMGTSLHNIIFISENLKIWCFRKYLKVACIVFCVVVSLFVFKNNLFIYEKGVSIFYINLWWWGSTNDEYWLNKISQSLDAKFISIKNMKWKFAKSYQLFYFR